MNRDLINSATLTELLGRAVAQPLVRTNARDALVRAIFAVGCRRLDGDCAELFASLETEVASHGVINGKILELYLAVARQRAPEEAWTAHLDGVIESAGDPYKKRDIVWLVRRSSWLRPPRADASANSGSTAEKPLEAARALVEASLPEHEFVDSALKILRAPLIPAALVQTFLDAALRMKRADQRLRLIAGCVQASATIGDVQAIDACMAGVLATARDVKVLSVRDLLVAIRPLVVALRAAALADSARELVNGLEGTLPRDRLMGPLLAALAEATVITHDHDSAEAFLKRALAEALLPTTSHVDRYESGAAIAAASVHLTAAGCVRWCGELVDVLPRFTDTFVTSVHYPTHQLLIGESVVDALIAAKTAAPAPP